MNRRIAAVGCAAVALAGAVTVIVPQHALTLGRLAAATVAVVVGALVLGAVAPFVAREVPVTGLDVHPTVGAEPLDPHGLRDARRDLDRPSASGSVPTAVRDRLGLAVALRLQRLGIDTEDERGRRRAEELLGADSWRVLTETAPNGHQRRAAATAAVVHRTLDALEAVDTTTGASHGHR